MAVEKYIAVANMTPVVENEKISATTQINPVLADAYVDSVANAEKVEEVLNDLEKKAEEIKVESPEVPEVKKDNIYTKKLTLDESVEDFNIDLSKGESRSEADYDRYVDFNMFDFIYNLFSSEVDSLNRPLKALSNITRGTKGATSFRYQGADDYTDETGPEGAQGINQITTDLNGNVVLHQDSIEHFEQAKAICDEYGFEYEGPFAKKAPWLRWNFSMTVKVPTYADGYPMEIEDYFEKRGLTLADVMPSEFVKGREKVYKKLNDETAIEVIFKKYVTLAGNSNDPLDGFIKNMFKELDDLGVKYDRKELKDRFLYEFNDDFEDDEDTEERLLSNAISMAVTP